MKQSIVIFTHLPKQVVDCICKDVLEFDEKFETAGIGANGEKSLTKKVRDCQVSPIPEEHWISGFIWHYVMIANKKNFLFDINCIDSGSLQYLEYKSGQHYTWHSDECLLTRYEQETKIVRSTDPYKDSRFNDLINNSLSVSRKISFSLQLSNPDEYEGGELQIMDYNGKPFFCPKERGTLVLFDSRSKHRVRKVKTGIRKSIVGWVIGNQWK